MSEANLYKTFKRNWEGYIRRIEPKDISAGIPDCHLVNNGKDIFIELKFVAKFKDRKLPVKNSQIIWFIEYKGSNAFMLFEVGQFYYLVPRHKVIELKDKIKFDDFESLAVFRCSKMKDIVNYLKLIT
jgi:hypothetical protein